MCIVCIDITCQYRTLNVIPSVSIDNPSPPKLYSSLLLRHWLCTYKQGLVSELLKEGCKCSRWHFSSLPSFICCQTYCQQFKAALVVSACHHDITQACSLPTSIMGHERSPESERKTACPVELQLAVTVILWFCKYLVVP